MLIYSRGTLYSFMHYNISAFKFIKMIRYMVFVLSTSLIGAENLSYLDIPDKLASLAVGVIMMCSSHTI